MRGAFLESLIGQPWRSDGVGGFNCYTLASHVSDRLFQRPLPDAAAPSPLTWRSMMDSIERHPERQGWSEADFDSLSPKPIQDGALVLMARSTRPAHIGIWLKPEGGVLHCDEGIGVVFETLSTLQARGWQRLIFLEPKA